MAEGMKGSVARSGREVGWRSVGSGPPLVLVNGYGGTTDDWDPNFLSALAETFEVVLPDNRGMGSSTWGDDGEVLSIASMADDVLALADELLLPRFALVGWSMGGFIAQTIAAKAPERITGLGLLGTDAGGPSAVLADADVWGRLTDSSGSDREQATRLLGVLFPAELAAELDEQVGPLVAAARAAIDHDVLRAQEAAMAAWHEAEPPAVPDGAPRTLVACGALDVVIPAANAPIVADRWSATMPITYEGCGHAVMAQVPFDLAAQLAAHLA
jgi:pimeloyl-ACP methyl ester carboxylesterase